MTYHCSSDSCRRGLLVLLPSPRTRAPSDHYHSRRSAGPLLLLLVFLEPRWHVQCSLGLCSALWGGEPKVVTVSVVSQFQGVPLT